MKDTTISDSIFYVGADDTTLDLFESQYIVPEGVSYNSYVIMDDKITIMDTVDQRATEEWIANVKNVLKDKTPAYLVVSHMEPDHAANIQKIAEMYPEMKIIGNAKTFSMMPQFFDFDLSNRSVVVKEGEEISLGAHTLQFFMAPMVHWPEVMVTYEKSEKILFSADGFGKFGALSVEADWACEARRYYFNIVGKYGAQVQALLKKAATLDIQMICPLHGPILKENLGYYIDKEELARNYLAMKDVATKGCFVEYFLGSPWLTTGSGCFAPAIANTANAFFKANNSKYSAYIMSYQPPEMLYAQLAKGHPVIVWTSFNYDVTEIKYNEVTLDDGTVFTWPRNEHCVALAGYDVNERTVTLADPAYGIVKRDMDKFEDYYKRFYYQAVVIE